MTRWFLIFIASLLIVLGARYATYSPLPAEVFADCKTPVTESKLQGLWELNRIDNYEAFYKATQEQNSAVLNTLKIYLYPFLLERSQLYRVEQCGRKMALTVNYLRSWLIATAEIEKLGTAEAKDFKSEVKETFEEVLTDVKDALALETKPEVNKTLEFIRHSSDLEITAELNFSGEEIIIYGLLNGKNYKEKIYFDTGELVREIAFSNSESGSTDFIYRRYP